MQNGSSGKREQKTESTRSQQQRLRTGVDPAVLDSLRARRQTRRANGGRTRGGVGDERLGGGAVPLGSILSGLLREHHIGSRDPVIALAGVLREVAGARVGPHLRPVRLRGRELCVLVDSSSLLNEMRSFTGRDIEQRFTETCRARRLSPVERLVFRHAH